MPTVSVIIPAFNRAHTLERAVRSVLSQSFGDLEVLVVDDASTDGTRELLSDIGDCRIRYLRHEKNRGAAAARNTGVETATGCLISFLDSDDEWLPGKLERDVSYLAARPNVAAVFSDLRKTDGAKAYCSFVRETDYFRHMVPAEPSRQWVETEQMYICLLHEVPIKMPTLTARVSVLRDAGPFDSSLASGEDWEFLIRLARGRVFAYYDAATTVVHVEADALHRRHYVGDKHAMIQVLWREFQGADASARCAIRAGVTNLWCHLGWHYLGSGDRVSAIRAFLSGYLDTGNWKLLGRAVAACLRV